MKKQSKFSKLIHVGRHIRPGGGPAGYLFNLKSVANTLESSIVSVCALTSKDHRSAPASSDKAAIVSQFPLKARKIIFRLIITVRNLVDCACIISLRLRIKSFYPVFHDQNLAYIYSKIFSSDYALMPHQPIELSREASINYSIRYDIDQDWIYTLLVKREVLAYLNANLLVLPTEYSLDSYFNNSPAIKSKLNFVPRHLVVSSVKSPKPKNSRQANRKRLGIQDDCIAIGYFGRYIYDKGFDLFIALANKYSNIPNCRHQFFSAGSGPLSKCISRSSIVNLGWIEDVYDAISAMDLILLPNRHTYFDLLPIEALLIGTPIAVTNIGGNKWLLNTVKDFSIQSLDLGNSDKSDNLLEVISNIPPRVEFQKTGLDTFFDEVNFLRSHESLLKKIN